MESIMKCTTKWISGAIAVCVLSVILMNGTANAASVASTGVTHPRHIVVEDINEGHIIYYYKTTNKDKLKLIDTAVMYNGKVITAKHYKQLLIDKDNALAERLNAYDKIRQDFNDAIRKVDQGSDQPLQCSNPR